MTVAANSREMPEIFLGHTRIASFFRDLLVTIDALGILSLPSELGRFLIGYYVRFGVCCAKAKTRISPTDPMGHVCCKIFLFFKVVINRHWPFFSHFCNDIYIYIYIYILYIIISFYTIMGLPDNYDLSG